MRRRRPELTPCYTMIQDHIDSLNQARIKEGRPLTVFVFEEFDAFLRCVIRAFSFLGLVWRGYHKKFFAKVHRTTIDFIHSFDTTKASAPCINDPAPTSISFT